MGFKEDLLKSQERNNRIWDREFEKNGNSTESVWDKTQPQKEGR